MYIYGLLFVIIIVHKFDESKSPGKLKRERFPVKQFRIWNSGRDSSSTAVAVMDVGVNALKKLFTFRFLTINKNDKNL